MSSRFEMLRGFVIASVTAALLLFGSGNKADAITIPFDYGGGTTVVGLVGTGPAALNFTLDLGSGAGTTGDFSMDVQNKDGVTIGRLDLLTGTPQFPGPFLFGDIAAPPGVFDIALYDTMEWFLNLAAADLSPAFLVIKSTLTPDPDFTGFSPLLSVSILEGDVAVTSTPIPGALPLFAGGLGVFGYIGWRRRKQVSPVQFSR